VIFAAVKWLAPISDWLGADEFGVYGNLDSLSRYLKWAYKLLK
jgi:hypothetical protein